MRPLRVSGNQWLFHIVSAIKRVFVKDAAYVAHLAKDSSVKPADYKEYLGKWVDAKCLLGCIMFADLLTPCMTFFQVYTS